MERIRIQCRKLEYGYKGKRLGIRRWFGQVLQATGKEKAVGNNSKRYVGGKKYIGNLCS
jgi:hypothetical protein